MQEKTSSGYDILYPQTIAAQIEDVYSKDETITTATKALYGLGETATPNQVFSAISTALDGKARIQTGSYVGTGTYGASNPCSLTFLFLQHVKTYSFHFKTLTLPQFIQFSHQIKMQFYLLIEIFRNFFVKLNFRYFDELLQFLLRSILHRVLKRNAEVSIGIISYCT